MSLTKCLQSAADQGAISRAEAEDLAGRYDAYRKARMAESGATADVLAKADVAAELRAIASEKKRRVALQAVAFERVKADVASYRTAGGEQDVAEGALAVLEHYGQGAPFSSVEGRRKSIVGMVHAEMENVLHEFERKGLLGKTQNVARLDNVVREALGENTGDAAAKGLAQTWGAAAEKLRTRFNAAGGHIGELKSWGLPQSHDQLALVRRGKDAWKADIMPLLAPEKMRNGLTGMPLMRSDLDGVLDAVYDNIVSDGWATREATQQRVGRGPISSQNAEHRFLVFKDADAWLDYQKAYGEGNPFSAMMGHVNLMARDIAAMEILGPNPDAMVNYLEQSITRAGKRGEVGLDNAMQRPAHAGLKTYELRNMWNMMRGASEAPVSTRRGNFMVGARNWVTASVMGSAIVSAAPTDPVFQMLARKMAGLPVMSAMADMAKAWKGTTRSEAVRMGLILDSAMHSFSTEARYAGTLSGPQWTRFLADRVLHVSGLTPWTQASRHAFGLAFLGEMAERVGQEFDALHPRLKQTMENYGIVAKDWDVMRSVKLHEPEPGATFLRPQEVAAKNPALAERLLEMVLSETEYAVPSGTVRGKAFLLGNTKAGTFWGEVARSFSMFKSFGITFALLYGGKAMRETASSKAAGAAYAGSILLTTTLGGAMAMWLKDLINGRDPRPIGKTAAEMLKFGGAAMLQGGGLGIYGDFLFADINRFGGGPGTTLGGPMAQRVNDIAKLTLGNLMQLSTGEDTDVLDEARDFASTNIPGSNLWFMRLAYQRVALDQLQYLTDPNANKAFKRRQQNYKKNNGQDMWWKPGQVAPERMPRF